MKEPKELEQTIKKLKEALKEEKANLERFIENNPYSIEIMDPDGHFVKANRAFYKLYKIAPPRFLSVFNSKQMQKNGCVKGILQAKKGIPYKSSHLWFDIHEDLPIFPSRPLCLTVSAFPIYDAEKKVKYLVFIHEDVTEEAKAKLELERKEAELNSIISTTSDAIVSFDPKFKIIFWNKGAETLFGYSQDQILKHSLETIIAKEDRNNLTEKLKPYFDIAQKKGFPTAITEIIGIDANKERINLELTFSYRNITKDHFLVGRIITAIVRDISKTKRFQDLQKNNAELEKLNKIMVGRELKMIELKEEMRKLKARLS